MGISISTPKYYDNVSNISENGVRYIRSLYTVIDVDWLDKTKVNYKMFLHKNITTSTKEIVNEMLDYYLSHKDKAIYKKLEYLCNEKEKVCICNTHADDFRKIYDGVNYQPNEIYISWLNKYI